MEEERVIANQMEICKKNGVELMTAPFDSIIGIALKSFSNSNLPINGLRHIVQQDGYAGWYIWAGDYSDADDFFEPIHIKHLLEIYPRALNYLGLPIGWRFLIDSDGYEDVWHDEELLRV